jgi:hypothetical protein
VPGEVVGAQLNGVPFPRRVRLAVAPPLAVSVAWLGPGVGAKVTVTLHDWFRASVVPVQPSVVMVNAVGFVRVTVSEEVAALPSW